MNQLAKRIVLAKLPHGSLFTQLILPNSSSIRASGDDLANYFYLFKHREGWLGRNTVGKPVKGEHFIDFGCDPKKEYILRSQILRDAHCMDPTEVVAFRSRLPAKPAWEGCILTIL